MVAIGERCDWTKVSVRREAPAPPGSETRRRYPRWDDRIADTFVW